MKSNIIKFNIKKKQNFHGALPMNSYFLFLFLCFFFFIQCKAKSENKETIKDISAAKELNQNNDLPSDFLEFYKKFHEDSLYQLARIDFPLEGLPDNADPEFIGNEKYYWSADQWILNKAKFDDKKLYEVQYSNLANVIIEETITIKEYDLKIIRRFSKSGDGWKLIYYAGVNKYVSQ